MCTHNKWVFNPHNGHRYYVKCGKCEACQQEKANKRTARIRNNMPSNGKYINLFTTFTYANECAPYVLREDLDAKKLEVPVYRDSVSRYVRVSSDYRMSARREYRTVQIGTIVFEDSRLYENYSSEQYFGMKNYPDNKISVCWYEDIQNFYKRLRQNLQRVYHYEKPFSFFQCSELGSVTRRAHFHGLVCIPAEDEVLFRQAINKSWSFNDFSCSARKIEVAKKAASYVSSYVNRGSDFPKLFENNKIKPKHSYSQGYGMGNVDFSLYEILKKIDNRDLRYTCEKIVDNVPTSVVLPVPQYVCCRWFPKFKGYSKLTTSEKYELLQCPEKLYTKYANNIINDLCLVPSDVHEIVVRLQNSKNRFIRSLGYTGALSDEDWHKLSFKYAHYHIKCWNELNMQNLRMFYENKEGLPVHELYDNCYILKRYPFKDITLSEVTDDVPLHFMQPNKFSWRVKITSNLCDLYYKKDKSRKVVNGIMSKQGAFV